MRFVARWLLAREKNILLRTVETFLELDYGSGDYCFSTRKQMLPELQDEVANFDLWIPVGTQPKNQILTACHYLPIHSIAFLNNNCSLISAA